MKISKISIDMLDFLKTGKFGLIELGYSDKMIAELLGIPEYYSKEDVLKEDILVYGYIEFHFSSKRLLYMIFSDNFKKSPRGGRKLKLTKIGALKKKRSVYEVMKRLETFGISYKKVEYNVPPNQTILQLKTGICLTFINEKEEFGPDSGLDSFAFYKNENSI